MMARSRPDGGRRGGVHTLSVWFMSSTGWRLGSATLCAAALLGSWSPGFGDETRRESPSTAGVIKLNEIYRDMAGVDTREFIEIFGPAAASLELLTVIEIEGDYGKEGRQGTIDKVWGLIGLVIGDDGLFLMADEAVVNQDFTLGVSNRLENGTATYLLIADYDATAYPRGTDIDKDDDGVADDGVNLGAIIDGVAIVDGGVEIAEPETDRTYFDVVRYSSPGAPAPAGAARRTNGLDTESPDDFCRLSLSGDGSDGFAVPSPGADNTCVLCPPPGDVNNDGTIDLLDFGRLQWCYTGPFDNSHPPIHSACRCMDFDADDDIDLVDYDEFADLASR